ncbi:MAG: phosphopyruvate hydratase [Gemmataceae bacterium]
MNATITAIRAREVLDSRGHPTVEVDVSTSSGGLGRAIVPSGASTGRHEALELRDGDLARYGGKGVRRAVASVNETIATRLIGLPVADQATIDQTMRDLDGTPDKSRLGANAILGVSLAAAHAAAAAAKIPLWQHIHHLGQTAGLNEPAAMPLPMVNLISGGLHAGGNLDFQDFLFLPIGANSYAQALEWTVKVYRTLSSILQKKGYEGVLVGDEGGFGPKLNDNRQALDLVVAAYQQAGLEPGKQAAIALDVASTHFHRDGFYHLRGEKPRDAAAMVELLADWAARYPILSIEDGLAEDDWPGWKLLTDKLGAKIQLVGDDLFVTNPDRLRRGIAGRVANSVLVKVNQIGSLSESLEVIRLARAAGYRPVVSARSGETEDSTMADLAVGTAAGQIKIGSVARSERLAKYNQLLRIEEQLGDQARLLRPFR